MHTNTKGENRLVTLKQSMDYDDAFLSELDKVVDFANRYIASVVKTDKTESEDKYEVIKNGDGCKHKITIIEEGEVLEESKEGPKELEYEREKGRGKGQEKRRYVTTEELRDRLEREFRPGVPFNVKDIKTVGKFRTSKDVYYHLDKLINKGSVAKLEVEEGKGQLYAFKEGPKGLISTDKIASYHRDLYAR